MSPYYLILNDDCKYIPVDEEMYVTDNFDKPRSSCDTVVNNFGYQLIELCKVMNMHIVNGRTHSDSPGNLTFISSTGTSVVDYFIVSTPLFSIIDDMIVLPQTDSDH